MVTQSSSLRERSKIKRRRAIQRAALQLFAERGYDGATIAEIADVAEVAARTVTLYFPTKLDIAMAFPSETCLALTTAFRVNPGLTFTEVIDRWLLGEAGSIDGELAIMTAAMLTANPSLRAVFSTLIAEAADVGGTALMAEADLSPDHPLLPILGAAVAAALSAYLDSAAKGGTPPQVHQSFMRYLHAIIAAARPVEGVPSGFRSV